MSTARWAGRPGQGRKRWWKARLSFETGRRNGRCAALPSAWRTSRAAYTLWREEKLAVYPKRIEDLFVDVNDLGAPTPAEREAIRRLAGRANMVLYATRSNLADQRATRRDLIAFGRAFGLVAIEDHRSAEADGVVRIEVVNQGGRLGYIPYTDRPINWHTDGYYDFHGPERRCARCSCIACARRGRAASTGCSIPKSPISACGT